MTDYSKLSQFLAEYGDTFATLLLSCLLATPRVWFPRFLRQPFVQMMLLVMWVFLWGGHLRPVWSGELASRFPPKLPPHWVEPVLQWGGWAGVAGAVLFNLVELLIVCPRRARALAISLRDYLMRRAAQADLEEAREKKASEEYGGYDW